MKNLILLLVLLSSCTVEDTNNTKFFDKEATQRVVSSINLDEKSVLITDTKAYYVAIDSFIIVRVDQLLEDRAYFLNKFAEVNDELNNLKGTK